MSESLSTRFPRLVGLALSLLLVALATGCKPSATRVFEDGQRLVEAERFEEAIEKLNEARTAFEDDPVLWSLMGLALHRTGQLERAETAYHQATTLAERADLPLPDIHVKLAELYIDRGRPSLAIPLLEERLQVDPSAVDSLLLLGVAYRTQLSNATSDADRRELLRKGEDILADGANKAGSSRDEIFHQLALLYLEAQDTRRALQYAQRAVNADPDNERAWWSYANLSHLNLQAGTAQPQAIQAVMDRYQKYIDISQDTNRREKAQQALAVLRGDTRPTGNAPELESETPVSVEPETPPVVVETETETEAAPAMDVDAPIEPEAPAVEITEEGTNESENSLDSGDAVEIAGGAGTTIEIERPEPEPEVSPAETRDTETKEPTEHEQSFVDAPDLETKEPVVDAPSPTIETEEVATVASNEQRIEPEPSRAETPSINPTISNADEEPPALAETAVPAEPEPATISEPTAPEVAPEDRRRVAYEAFRMGTAAQREGGYDAAIRFYSDALRYDPNFYECLFNRAYCYFRQARYPEAAESYRRALQARPGAANTRRNYAITLVRLGRFSEALAQVNAWIQQEPRSPEAHLLAAKIAADKVQDVALARYHYNVFLTLSPASPDAPAIRNWLQRDYTARQP